MGDHWLYNIIKGEKKDWKPTFALQSTLNWMNALSFEITKEHGGTTKQKYDSCRNIFKSNTKIRSGDINLAPIFGPLYHSLNFTVSLISLKENEVSGPWMFPGAIVSWYYAVYNSFKSILASLDSRETETHSSLIKALNGQSLRPKLPHPFNMIAIRKKNVNYNTVFPDYPDSKSYDLSKSFTESRSAARGMILQYLNGTAKWESEKVKKRVLSKEDFDNFRTKKARKIRNEHLSNEINFMNCAFRYRGKANYRDSMFINYGRDNSLLDMTFIENMVIVAKFSFLCGFAYAERRIGKQNAKNFLDDIGTYFRGQDIANKKERFWEHIS